MVMRAVVVIITITIVACLIRYMRAVLPSFFDFQAGLVVEEFLTRIIMIIEITEIVVM